MRLYNKSVFRQTIAVLAVAMITIALACGSEEPTPTSEPTIVPAPATATPAPESTNDLTRVNQTNEPTKGVTMPNQYSAPPPMSIDPSANITATMHTSEGDIVFELFASEAPNTVNNFVFLAREGFYDGVIFHRIIKGFMVQSGDPQGTGMGGPGYSFADEPVKRAYLPGTLAMANAGPNTNGSQFFIMHQEAGLPPNYTIFGIAVEGLDVVDALANTPVTTSNTGERSKPVEPPTISGIEITETAG